MAIEPTPPMWLHGEGPLIDSTRRPSPLDTEHRSLPLRSHAAEGEDLVSILQALLEAGQAVVQTLDKESRVITYTLVSGCRIGVVRRIQSVSRRERGRVQCAAYLVGRDDTLRKYNVRARRFRKDSWERVDYPTHEVDDLRGALASLLQLVAA